MESEDYPFFQGLVYLLENNVSTLGYELTFSTEVLPFCVFLYEPNLENRRVPQDGYKECDLNDH